MGLLEQWGASEQYYKIASGYPEYELGRVISQEKDLFCVVMDKEECTARVSGNFRINRRWSTANKVIPAENKDSSVHRFFGCRKINIDQ